VLEQYQNNACGAKTSNIRDFPVPQTGQGASGLHAYQSKNMPAAQQRIAAIVASPLIMGSSLTSPFYIDFGLLAQNRFDAKTI